MSRVDRYWDEFVASLPPEARPERYVEAFHFGTDPTRAHEITPLVLDGTKTATGALLWSLEADGKRPARAGDLWVVTNGSDDPQCIIRTDHVRVIPFDEVGEEFARWGGEWDRTLASWRRMYWRYIEDECARIGRAPDPKAPLVMERFHVVHPAPPGGRLRMPAPDADAVAAGRPGGPDLQPTLEGDQVLLRPLEAADWEGLFAVASDPEVWAQHPAPDRYQEAVFRQFFQVALSSRAALTCVERETGTLMGSSRYHGHDPARREVEIGWTFLGRSWWGRGHNAEMKRLMLGHAFSFVDTVVFWVGVENHRSRRAMEKIGGVLRPGLVRRQPGDAPHVVYEIRRDAWTGLR